GNVTTTRSLETFDDLPVETALLDAARVRAKVSDERWRAFSDDWAAMARTWGIDWSRVISDHGNSNSPAWSLVAAPLASLVPLSARNQSWLGWLDMVLMLGLWLFIYDTFGRRVASVGLLVWAAPPNVFDFLAGSLLRWDWLFAIGLSACFIKRERWAAAGAFFAYAVATKLFPLFFGVALGLKALAEFRQTKRLRPEHVRFAISAAVTGVVLAIAAAVAFGADAWSLYAQRIQVAQVEKYYTIQYSLKTVFLQFFAPGESALAVGLFPSQIKQALPDVDIANYSVPFWLVRLAFTAAVFVLARRANDVEAFLLGPLLVFTWLTVNMYYWNMLGLLAVGLVTRPERALRGLLIAVHVMFMVFYLYQHLNRGATEAYAVALLFAVSILGSALWEWRDTAEPPAEAEPDAAPTTV
ncbi:MAG: hypothetical protein JNG84_09310, partial [Archangium sp.]|nr:hypothetical protein [Archangium sp.]